MSDRPRGFQPGHGLGPRPVSAPGRSPDGPGLLRAWRAEAGLTQHRLAELADVNVRTIRGIELGSIAQPRRSTLDLIARALNLTVGAHLELLAAWGIAASTPTLAQPAPSGRRRAASRMQAVEEQMAGSWESVHIVAFTDVAVVGEDRHIESRTTQGVALALVDNVSSRWVFYDLTDDRIDVDKFHLTDLDNCEVLEERVDESGHGKLFNIGFGKTLNKGETALFRYCAAFGTARADGPPVGDHCQELTGFRRPPASYILEVRFSAASPPERAFQIFQARPTGPVQEIRELDVSASAHIALANPRPGGHGIAWRWPA